MVGAAVEREREHAEDPALSRRPGDPTLSRRVERPGHAFAEVRVVKRGVNDVRVDDAGTDRSSRAAADRTADRHRLVPPTTTARL